MCRRIFLYALLLAASATLIVAGCKTSSTSSNPPTAPVAPGFSNAADQTMYSTLLAAQQFYNTLQQDAAAGKWTPSAGEKTALNTFAATLNVAEAEYLAFKAGTATQAQAQAAIDKVTAAESQLQSIVPAKPVSYLPDESMTRS